MIVHYPDTYGLDRNVFGKKFMLFLSKNEARKKMNDVRSDSDLETYLVDASRSQPKPTKLLKLCVAFGKSHIGDEVTAMSYFDIVDMTADSSPHYVQELPIEVVKRKKLNKDSQCFMIQLEEFMIRCYNDVDSYFHHGFAEEMKSKMQLYLRQGHGSTFQNSFMRNGNIQVPKDEASALPLTIIFQDEILKSVFGQKPQKDRYPPIDGKIPTLEAWARMKNITLHGCSSSKTESTIDKDISFFGDRRYYHSQIMTVVNLQSYVYLIFYR